MRHLQILRSPSNRMRGPIAGVPMPLVQGSSCEHQSFVSVLSYRVGSVRLLASNVSSFLFRTKLKGKPFSQSEKEDRQREEDCFSKEVVQQRAVSGENISSWNLSALRPTTRSSRLGEWLARQILKNKGGIVRLS